MKHLIIYAHPNQDSLNNLLKQTVIKTLEEDKHEFVIRDLYELNFDPILSLDDMRGQRSRQVAADISREQDYISWAETITFIYPIWWTGMPAIMKGYIDRVMSYGFAYQYTQGVQEGLLGGKQAVIINTHGKSNAEYKTTGMDQALVLTSDKGIYDYCGLEIKQHLFFGQADRASSESIENWITEVQSVYK
ncbi:NAD(P)H-dependent oxidoreductase [Flavobacterium humi]|uniref:Flavodoxin family protein n=1 Tax=Flavobacterium humi TaxID=2562683 RepID=A0A4Z0LD49_9FLAO|nr:NAD(P)H-dependent oxidoreductase [Flavobacterium humi]TGD59797.1 flavodoxin family protein [Flavobacterium humi]